MLPFDALSDLQGKSKVLTDHRGIVLDNKDPEKKCRLKILVPGVQEAPIADLPWAIPKYEAFLGGHKEHSAVVIPEINTEVTVQYPHGDTHFPIYTAKWNQEKVPEEFRKNYPERWGLKDSTGTYFYFDKKEETFKFHHCSGVELEISKEGDVKVNIPGKIEWEVGKNWKATVAQGMEWLLGKESSVTAPSGAKFITPILESTGQVKDSVRTMSADRMIYNMHTHMGFHGPTTPPIQSK